MNTDRISAELETHPKLFKSSVLDRIFPATYCRTESPWIAWFSLIFLILLPITILISEDATRLSITILLLTKLISWKNVASSTRNKGLYWLALAFFLYMFIAIALASINFPIAYSEHWQFTERCIFLFGFLLVGWWMGDSARSREVFIYLIYAGLVLGLIKYSSTQDWMDMLKLKRTGFGLHNWEHAALWFGSGLMLVVFHLSQKIESTKQRMFKIIINICLLILFLMVFVATQTRAAWLGLLAGLIFTSLLLLIFQRSGDSTQRYRYLLGGGLVIVSVLLITVSIYFSDGFRSKIIHDYEQSKMFVQGADNVTPSSMVIRLFEWRYALELIEDRPLLGYGPATKSELLKKKKITDFIGTQFGHFHSSYLDLAIGFGLPGTFFFLLLLVSIYYSFVKRWITGEVNEKIIIFISVWIIYFAVMNIFESYVFYRTGYSSFTLFVGVMFASAGFYRSPKVS
jgi:O-antigen ligase